ncbi:carbohydrate ABC transporter permease [Phytohabitans kaempferiae]|uniref:Carbohydrate ABC transporter permease n=1 Tax=Phytohabitans kaempferiae TaxID=1620943 RepID=A0ABV6LXJ0_9ACTN
MSVLARRAAAPSWQRAFLAPLLVVLVATTVLPLLYMLALSLGPKQGQLSVGRPQGLHNYRELLTSSEVWHSLLLAVIFLVGALVVELVLGVGTAVLLDRLLPGNPVVRMLLLWPTVLPPIAVALVFKYVLQGDIGLVSYYLSKVGIHQAWLTEPVSAMAVIIAIDIWQYTPFVILLALAALTAIPHEVREAAALDGAGPVSVARRVVLPMIKPAIIAIAMLRFIDAIQVFPTIYALTRGGPGTSTQLLTYFNYQAFFGQLEFGYGAAIAVLVVVFTIACVTLLLTWQRRAEAS